MTENVYIGGYTRHLGLGIYRSQCIDGQLKTPALFLNIGNPTYFTIDTKHQRLFTIMTKGQQGGVAAYDIAHESPRLINQVLAPGRSPAYITYDAQNSLLFDANYHKGQAHAYRVSNDGVLTLADTFTQVGHGPRPEQKSAHIHYIDRTPEGRLVLCDLGSDEIVTCAFKDNHFQKVATYHTEPGFAPRHIAFHPTRPVAYALGELSSQLAVLAYDPTNGQFTPLRTLSLVPTNYTGQNGSAAIRLSNDGHFLYASNRGHNSIAVYAITNAGKDLNLIQHISTAGDGPRDFALDPTEKYVLAANQNTDNLTLYQRDATSGRLTVCQQDVPCPEGTCVKFDR